ncbi:MAG: YCII-like protein [Spirochaetes bacterium]|nr:MAG: YCII-like protein [Spirochaetota bacterium]
MFVITSVYLKPLDVVDKFLKEHRDFLDAYYKKGLFIASGRKSSGGGGVIFAKGGTKEDLEKILAEDPFSREAISRYEIIEFVPNRVAEGYESLK